MAKVQLIDGRLITDAQLTDVRHVGEEGSRSAIAHVGDQTYSVYNSVVDGFNDLWQEQMTWETYKMTKGATGFVEGSASLD